MAKIKYSAFIKKLKELFDKEKVEIEFSKSSIRFGAGKEFNDWLKESGADPKKDKDEISYKISLLSRIMMDIMGSEKKPQEDVNNEFVDEDYLSIVQMVKDIFVDKNFQNKFLFEKTVKNLVLEDIDWEIQNKLFDSNIEDKVKGIKTCLIRFNLVDRADDNKEKNMTVEFNENRINDLIEKLKKISSRLGNADS